MTLIQGQMIQDSDIWRAINSRIRELGMTPKEFAYRTEHYLTDIERGFRGEPAELPLKFLQACVKVCFSAVEGRDASYSELTQEECVEKLIVGWSEPVRRAQR